MLALNLLDRRKFAVHQPGRFLGCPATDATAPSACQARMDRDCLRANLDGVEEVKVAAGAG